jgi:hypothetical protein
VQHTLKKRERGIFAIAINNFCFSVSRCGSAVCKVNEKINGIERSRVRSPAGQPLNLLFFFLGGGLIKSFYGGASIHKREFTRKVHFYLRMNNVPF